MNFDPIAFKLLDSMASLSCLFRFCERSEIAVHTYGNVIVFGEPHFGRVEHGVMLLLLLPLYPKRYPSTKLDDRELCVMQCFFTVFKP